MSSTRLPFSIGDRDTMSEQLTPLDPAPTAFTPGTPGTLAESSTEEPSNPLASRDMFFLLSLYSPPEWESDGSEPDDALPPLDSDLEQLVASPQTLNQTTPAPPNEYDNAVSRINNLDGFLTPSMKSSITCLLAVMQTHLSPLSVDGVPAIADPLFSRIASQDQTPDHGIKDIVDTIEKGLQIFSALGGGSTGSGVGPTSLPADDAGTGPRKRQKFDADGNVVKTTRRSEKVRRDCRARDPSCQICNSVGGGDVAHIIPYSAKDQKGIDFWKFVELFRGVEATAALKAVALMPNPELVDTLKNVWFLCKSCHDAFGRAQLAIIPDLDGITYPYDPDLTSSVRPLDSSWFLLRANARSTA